MASLTVRPLDTGVAQGFNDLPVLAANSALNVIESACSAAIAEYFETGETTFTIGAAIQMRGAVAIGAEVRALVKATEFSENILTFECEIHQEQRIIAVAQVQRRLVDRVSFMARSAAENLPRTSAASELSLLGSPEDLCDLINLCKQLICNCYIDRTLSSTSASELCCLVEQGVELWVCLEVWSLEVISPENPEVVLDHLRALFLNCYCA